jgi:hypothetical protein
MLGYERDTVAEMRRGQNLAGWCSSAGASPRCDDRSGVVREDRLLNEFAFYDRRSPRDINREQGSLIFRFHLDFEEIVALLG